MRAKFFKQRFRAKGTAKAGPRALAARVLVPLVFGLLPILPLLHCQSGGEQRTPEQTVKELLDRMQRIHGDPERSLAAYELMSKSTRANLADRAKRASAAAGRVVRPEEMLAPSRFFMDFPVTRWSSQRGKDWALVSLDGEGPGAHREIRCRLEKGEWRVVIELPRLPPVQKR